MSNSLTRRRYFTALADKRLGDRDLPGGHAYLFTPVPSERRPVSEELRFVAVYAAPDVVTRYERVVQPDGSRERQTVS